MRKTLAVAQLTMRNAWRSRAAISVAVFVLLAATLIPAAVDPGGNAVKYARVAVRYALGTVSFLLGALTLWSACALAAVEIQDRRIHLVVTKPVHLSDLFLGKWLGLVALNCALLALAGIGMYAVLAWRLAPLEAKDTDGLPVRALAARSLFRPRQENTEGLVRKRLLKMAADAREAGANPGLLSDLRHIARAQVMEEADSVAPGGTRRWSFKVTTPPATAGSLRLRLRFNAPQIDLASVPLTICAGPPDDPRRHTVATSLYAGARHILNLPPDVVAADGDVVLECRNDSTGAGVPILFSAGAPPVLLVEDGTFPVNLVKAMVGILCRLGLFAAIGLAAGSLLSLPVASFASLAALLLFSMGGFIRSVVAAQSLASYRPVFSMPSLDDVIRVIYVAFDIVVSPVDRLDGVRRLADGEIIPFPALAMTFLVVMVLYAGAVGWAGVRLAGRRELGLPAE